MPAKLLSFSKNIKRLRYKRDWSQEKLARQADISYNTLIKIESGAIKSPTIDTASKIARALKTTIDNLIRPHF